MSLQWYPRTHGLFGDGFNAAAGALMLGLRRLEALRRAPEMDPAVLEEMLRVASLLQPMSVGDCYWSGSAYSLCPRGFIGTTATKHFLVSMWLAKSPLIIGFGGKAPLIVGFGDSRHSPLMWRVELAVGVEVRLVVQWNPRGGVRIRHDTGESVACTQAHWNADPRVAEDYCTRALHGKAHPLHPFVYHHSTEVSGVQFIAFFSFL